MGTLRELGSKEKNLHMLITNSNLVEIYVYDELKKSCKATLESVYEIHSRNDFKDMLELVSIQSYLSDRWLFIIEYAKVKGMLKQYKGIFESTTSCFLITVKNYKEYKEFKEQFPLVNDLYLSFIRSNEVFYLLNGYELSQVIKDFIARSYSRDPEKIFILKKELDEGASIRTQKDVVALCGVSSGSITHFAMKLLTELSDSERGRKTVIKNRIKIADELIGAYGSKTLKNFLASTVKDFIYIKELYMVGVVYNSIRDIPEVFDEKRLSKYNFYLRKLAEEIPYGRLVRLYTLLKKSGVWYSKSDMLDFLYEYYGGQ